MRSSFPAGTRAPAVSSPAPLSCAPDQPLATVGRAGQGLLMTGCCGFRPSSLEAAGPFPSPAYLKAKLSPGPKLLQRESSTRLQAPAARRLCALQGTRADVSRAPADRARTTAPDRPRAAPPPSRCQRTAVAPPGLQLPRGRAPRLCARPLREG